MLYTVVSLIVVSFIMCLTSTPKSTDGTDTPESIGSSLDESYSVHTSDTSDDDKLEVAHSIKSTLENHIVYVKPNTFELLTEEFKQLPFKKMPKRYGWNKVA